MKSYIVTVCEIQQKREFKSIKGAKLFILKWCAENEQHSGKVDIDSKTKFWQVGTFDNPVIKFEKSTI